MKQFSLMLVMVLFSMSTILAQRTVTGTVMLDGEGEAIGANVVIEGDEGVGTVTEFDGTFSLSVSATAKALKISYTGFVTQSVSIDGLSEVSVTLSRDNVLEQVVVVGYQTLKKSDVIEGISVVDGEEIQQIPVGNVEQLLQGKSTGLQVIGSNGKPGSSGYMRIRGTGSANSSNEPLYVVDGAQVTATYMNAINPNDIETINVLKDAAATSIYGSSGANGVIVITTKRGSSKPGVRSEISFSSQFGIKQMIPDNFDMMDAQQKIDYETELFNEYGIGNGTRVASYEDPVILDSLLAVSGDWQDILLRNGVFQSYNLSLAGSSDKARYFMSMGYYDEEGIAKVSNFERMSARFSTDYDASDWLTIGSSFAISRSKSNELRDRYNVQNPFVAMYTYNPYESEYLLGSPDVTDILYDENGNPEFNRTHAGFSISEAIQNNTANNQDMQFDGQMYAQAKLYKGLTFKTTIRGNLWQRQRETFLKPGSILDQIIYGANTPTGSGSFSTVRRYNYQWNNVLTYSHVLKEKHNLSYLLGHELYAFDSYSSFVAGEGYATTGLPYLTNAAVIDDGGTNRNQVGKLSFFANARYSYDSKYLASVTYRTDASSSFGSDYRYGHFYGVSAGWNIHNEKFAEDVFKGKVDQLKLRASIGTAGNDTGASSYTRLGVLGTTNYGTGTALIPSRPASSELRWEKSSTTSLGLDFGLFKNRVTGAIDLYRRKTTDLLFDGPLALTSGVPGNTVRRNVGAFVNKGVEIELNVTAVSLPKHDLRIDVFGSFSLNDNKVVELADLDGDPETPSEIFQDGNLVTEGEEYLTFQAVRFAGIDPATGDELYYDIDGNVTNIYSADDAVTLSGKSSLARIFGTFGSNISYKGFNVGINFYYSGGNYIFNQQSVFDLLSNGADIDDNQRVDANDFWRNPGDVTTIGRPTGINNPTDRHIQRGDFMRLKNIRIGYTLPVKSKWLTSVNIFAQGNNLATWTAFDGDPEVGISSGESTTVSGNNPGLSSLYSYPQTRGFTLGLNVNF